MDRSAFALESLRREFGDEIPRMFARLRFVIAPIPLLLGGLVIVADDSLWRRITIGLILTSAAIAFAHYLLRPAKLELATAQRLMMFVGMVLHPVLLVATGGVFSPVLVVMLMVAYTASTMLERRQSLRLLGVQVGSIVVTAILEFTQLIGPLIPSPFNPGGLSGAGSAWPFLYGGLASLFFLVASAIGYRIQRITIRLLEKEVSAREESLRLHREQLTELTVLSGEIAHELKNPLASIKGLGALLARRCQGQEPEPLVVLRREADRMQWILDEFLNLSRPLIPLNLAQTELAQLTLDVCAMHQGIAELRGIHICVHESSSTRLWCDERKVRQILVNLLQNALDATPDGGSIEIRFSTREAHIDLAIDDSGTGLDPRIAERAFEAGVTNKKGGSGLGLNVARGLARQHGGDVRLTNQQEGGCRAVLSLPNSPPSATASDVSNPETAATAEAL